MSDARELTAQLGGRWHGRYGTAPCPVCQPDRRREQDALTLTDGTARLLLHCKKGGCRFEDIAAALGLRSGEYCAPGPGEVARRKAEQEAEAAKREAQALRLRREAVPVEGTIAERYLRETRAISCDLTQEPLDAVISAEAAVTTWREDVAAWRASEGDAPLSLLAYREHPAHVLLRDILDTCFEAFALDPLGDRWGDRICELLACPPEDLATLARRYEGIAESFRRETVCAKTDAERVLRDEQRATFNALAWAVWMLDVFHTEDVPRGLLHMRLRVQA